MADETTAPDDIDVQFDNELPVLPIRNAVLFPGAVAPFDVGREKSVALVEDIENLEQPVIAIFAQRDPSTDDPGYDDLHPVGVAARVLKALKHGSGNYSLILQGLSRIRLDTVLTNDPYLKARIAKLEEPKIDDVESEALAMSLRDVAKQVVALMPELPREASSLLDSIQEPGQLSIVSRPIVALLPTAPRAAGDPAVQGRRFFGETGHSLGGEFEAYWRRNGGLAVFGFPLSEEFVQRAPGEQAGYTVQYLERQRFELHPENQAPYNVLLGRLGAEALAAQGRGADLPLCVALDTYDVVPVARDGVLVAGPTNLTPLGPVRHNDVVREAPGGEA